MAARRYGDAGYEQELIAFEEDAERYGPRTQSEIHAQYSQEQLAAIYGFDLYDYDDGSDAEAEAEAEAQEDGIDLPF